VTWQAQVEGSRNEEFKAQGEGEREAWCAGPAGCFYSDCG
jgi:hypothetical protein